MSCTLSTARKAALSVGREKPDDEDRIEFVYICIVAIVCHTIHSLFLYFDLVSKVEPIARWTVFCKVIAILWKVAPSRILHKVNVSESVLQCIVLVEAV